MSMPSLFERVSSVPARSSNMIDRAALAAVGGSQHVLQRDRGLADAGGPEHERARARSEAAAEERVELGHAALDLLGQEIARDGAAATSRGKTSSPPGRMT